MSNSDLDNKEAQEKAKEYLKQKIDHYNQMTKIYSDTMGISDESTTQQMIAAINKTPPHIAIAWSTNIGLAGAFEAIETAFEAVFEVNDKVNAKVLTIDKQLQEISEQTGVDLSDIKTQVAQIKEAVEAPIYKYVKAQEVKEKEQTKNEAEILDWAIRSH